MIQRLSPLIPGLSDHSYALDKIDCDTIINAYTGLLHAQGATDILRDPEEGGVPKLVS